MRCYIVYYFKIFLIVCAIHELTCGVISTATNEVYKKLLQLRSLPFEDCGSMFQVMYLKIDGCTTIPCTMKRGDLVDVRVLFDDNGSGVSFLKHEVRWVFNYVKTQAAISPDPCDGNQECIESTGDGKTYLAKVYVNTTLPVMRGRMLWEAKDANSNNLICFEVPVSITL
ncbi:NPC intracellular cholesterol transporter 2 [Scaptodrosophila lebanonensis]|uniref:NPC intracellular cholesterol transporter 2 n=1 Tax=Drosophila lebanonensis TaxID=7225 RepID=A0A6J2T831_DROLE|nr:NPC intracellular cholesterol transporter 2 [Scaptodrosophila lebanonensis]